MSGLLYTIAVILLIIWAVGFFGYRTSWGGGNVIHILLILAIVAVLLRVISGNRPV